MWYFIGWFLFFIFFKLYLGFRVVGRHNVPRKGAFIFAANHVSYFDPILLGTSIYRSLNYMAREDLFDRPRLRWALKEVHAFPVKREKGDPGAIKTALGILKSGKPLVIFPEGTRAKDKFLRQGKPGVGFIAAKADVPVIPAYIGGSFEALPGGRSTLKRHPVSVYIGKPIKFDPANMAKNDREAYQKVSDEIMSQIAKLKRSYEDRAG